MRKNKWIEHFSRFTEQEALYAETGVWSAFDCAVPISGSPKHHD
jgi:hypothetical protein